MIDFNRLRKECPELAEVYNFIEEFAKDKDEFTVREIAIAAGERFSLYEFAISLDNIHKLHNNEGYRVFFNGEYLPTLYKELHEIPKHIEHNGQTIARNEVDIVGVFKV